MMVLLGVDSQFAHCDVPIQAFLDEYPNLLPKKFARSVNHLIPVRLSWSMYHGMTNILEQLWLELLA